MYVRSAAWAGKINREQLMGSQDTEITLGTGKMLALFFGLVALCGLFFGLGFSLGRGSVRSPMAADQMQTSGTAPVLRPSAMKSGSSPQSSDGMTFYKAVEQKDANAQLAPAEAPAQTKDSPANAPDEASAKATPPRKKPMSSL